MEYFRLYEKAPGRSPHGFGNAGEEHNLLINPLFPNVETLIEITEVVDVGFLVNS
ncbi:MAG: hypothetical protein ABR572_09835 [Cryomorphaceae bacterium]